MADFLMKPKIDFAFKEIMADEKARKGFLAAVLKLNPEEIKETRLLNTHLQKVHEDDKLGILDVRVLMNDNTEIDIEINLSELKTWADRSLFYLAKMFVEQIRSGDDYGKFKKCVSISILDFTLFKDSPGFYSCFHILEDTRHTPYTDKMEFHVLELPKLPNEYKTPAEKPAIGSFSADPDINDGKSSILLWARFINAERKEEFDMLAAKDPYIESAYQQLQIISQDREKRLEYEAREKAIRDHLQYMREAEERGIERGRALGREEGKTLGMELGIKQEKQRMNKLIQLLIQSKRFDDLERSSHDPGFQQQLFDKYGL